MMSGVRTMERTGIRWPMPLGRREPRIARWFFETASGCLAEKPESVERESRRMMCGTLELLRRASENIGTFRLSK